jgi:hypothetical protein
MPGPWEKYQTPQGAPSGPWAKYQQPTAPAATPAEEQNSISAKPTGAAQWLRDLEGDVRYGGTTTLPGRILKKMGAQGLNVGSQGNADTVLQSTPLGPIHMAQGFAEKRPLHIAKGALETAELPLEFVGGPTAGAVADAVPVAGQIAKQTVKQSGRIIKEGARAIAEAPRPSAKLTRRTLESVEKVASHEGIAITGKTPVEKLTSLSDGFIARAKPVYQQLDKAAGGNLQPLLDKLDQLPKAIEANSVVNPKLAEELGKELVEVQRRKAQVVAQLASQGVTDAEKMIAVADRNYARGKQIERLAKKAHTYAGKAQYNGKVNPEKFARSLDTAKTIEQVEGGMSKQTMQEFTKHAQSALRQKKNIKRGLIGAGVLAGTTGVGAVAKNALTGN